MKIPRIIALLSWFDEHDGWLAATITSIAPYVDHVIAVDGAYALYPEAHAQSRSDQASMIVDVCHAANLGLTLHRPQHVWFGNEVEKRTRMFQLAELEAEPNVDWYFVVDADIILEKAPSPAWLSTELAETDLDVGQVRVWERGDPYRNPARLEFESMTALPADFYSTHPAFFRAVPGLHVDSRHYAYRAGDGRWLWGGPPGDEVKDADGNVLYYESKNAEQLDLRAITLEHRTHYRPKQRHLDQQEYYRRREQAGAESEPAA